MHHITQKPELYHLPKLQGRDPRPFALYAVEDEHSTNEQDEHRRRARMQLLFVPLCMVILTGLLFLWYAPYFLQVLDRLELILLLLLSGGITTLCAMVSWSPQKE